jgi:parvulin-like peptidyl-prolyl isomerase
MTMKNKMPLLILALLLAPGYSRATVVASVGSEKIDDVELNAKVGAEERNANRKFSADERQAVLQALVNQRLLVAEAKDEGLQKKDEVRRTVEDTERQLLSNLVYDREVAAKAAVTDAEVKAFFEKNPALFELRQVSQILVQPLSPDKAAAAESEAARLKAKVAASPKSFAETAKAESDDSLSKDKGGDLGWLRRGMLLKELEEAAFSAKAGSIVGPVKTQFGFHILQVRKTKKQPFAEAKDVIAREIARARAAELQQKLLDSLSKKFKVSIAKAK